MAHKDFTLTTEGQSLILERLYRLLTEHYVVPELVPAVEKTLRQQFDSGGFIDGTAADMFCEAVTQHIYACCHDRHLALRFHAEALPFYEDENLSRNAQRQAHMAELQTLGNFGFQKVERLDGNIGYLDLRFFSSPEIAGEIAVAAMAYLSHTNAFSGESTSLTAQHSLAFSLLRFLQPDLAHGSLSPHVRYLSRWQNQIVQPNQAFPTSCRCGRSRGWDVSRVNTSTIPHRTSSHVSPMRSQPKL